MLIAGKLKKRLSRDDSEITIQASLSVANGKLRISKIKLFGGKVKHGKVEQVADATRLYLSSFACIHHWKIQSPHTAKRDNRGMRKYSDGTCIRCNTTRKKFNNYLPEGVNKYKDNRPIVLIKLPKNKQENKLLLTFSSFVVKIDSNTYKVRKGIFR